MKDLIVLPNGKEIADFGKVARIGTTHLEACVALAARYQNKAALTHLKANCSLKDYLDWFNQNVPKRGSMIYLVGGAKGSEPFVEQLRRELKEMNYPLPREDVLNCINRRDLWISPGEVRVEHYIQARIPQGNLEHYLVSVNYL